MGGEGVGRTWRIEKVGSFIDVKLPSASQIKSILEGAGVYTPHTVSELSAVEEVFHPRVDFQLSPRDRHLRCQRGPVNQAGVIAVGETARRPGYCQVPTLPSRTRPG